MINLLKPTLHSTAMVTHIATVSHIRGVKQVWWRTTEQRCALHVLFMWPPVLLTCVTWFDLCESGRGHVGCTLYVLNEGCLSCISLIPHHQPHFLRCSVAMELQTVMTSSHARSSCLQSSQKPLNEPRRFSNRSTVGAAANWQYFSS